MADLGVKGPGSRQGGIRPLVIVSNDMANKYSPVVTAVPLTTRIAKKRHLPTHVFVSAYKNDALTRHSIALCEQITPLEVDKIIEVLGMMDAGTLAEVTKGIQVQVGVV